MVLAGNTLYGLTTSGGQSGRGTIFSINTDGSGFTVLYQLSGAGDNGIPEGGLILSGCTLYATAGNVLFSFAIVPAISGMNFAGKNLILNVTNGVANSAYTTLTSTNLALPLSQWTPVATNTLAQAGNFTVTNAIDSAAQRFYAIKAQ